MADSSTARTLKTVGQLSTVGLAFVFALVFGFAGGYWLDQRFGSSPWFSLLGFAMGLAAGVLNVVRTMRAVTAAESDARAEPPPPANLPPPAR